MLEFLGSGFTASGQSKSSRQRLTPARCGDVAEREGTAVSWWDAGGVAAKQQQHRELKTAPIAAQLISKPANKKNKQN